MPKRIDIAGKRFGRLTALEYLGEQRWRCRCDCGNSPIVHSAKLRRGQTKSCGCYRRDRAVADATIHGMGATPEHKSWAGMIERCNNANNPAFHRYGGRGIKVCGRWRFGDGGKHGFVCFLEDMGPKPSRAHSIDRYPNQDGDYEPGNCRWATWKEQRRNRADTVVVEIGGERMCATEAAERAGIRPAAVLDRLRNGWPLERALSGPLRPERGRR